MFVTAESLHIVFQQERDILPGNKLTGIDKDKSGSRKIQLMTKFSFLLFIRRRILVHIDTVTDKIKIHLQFFMIDMTQALGTGNRLTAVLHGVNLQSGKDITTYFSVLGRIVIIHVITQSMDLFILSDPADRIIREYADGMNEIRM